MRNEFDSLSGIVTNQMRAKVPGAGIAIGKPYKAISEFGCLIIMLNPDPGTGDYNTKY